MKKKEESGVEIITKQLCLFYLSGGLEGRKAGERYGELIKKINNNVEINNHTILKSVIPVHAFIYF